jgi:hypothetical protein
MHMIELVVVLCSRKGINLKMKYIKFLTTAVLLASISNITLAGPATSCADRGLNNIDYSDAPNSYGAACNQTQRWQALGPGTDSGTAGDVVGDSRTKYRATDGYKDWTRENGVNTSGDEGDDGVRWRTSSDNGVTWTDFGTDGVITQGDVVEFSFLVGRSQTGTHEFDQVKAWADWNVDGDFDNDASEILINEKWAMDENSSDIAIIDNNGKKNTDLSNNAGVDIFNDTDLFREYTAQIQIPLDAVLGDSWLRARITCENALDNHGDGTSLLATGFYDQGETEDYQITIAAKTVTDVPEPSTLLVFALGVLGIAAGRKKLKTS